MHPSRFRFLPALLAAALAACSRTDATADAPAAAPPPGPDAAQVREASAIRADPVAYAESAVRRLDEMADRLRALEEARETSRQKAQRALAALEKNEADCRRFGRAGKPLYDAAETAYPIVVEGRTFSSRAALQTELTAVKRAIERAARNRPRLANQIARDAADLADIRTRLAQNATQKDDLLRKADAAKTALAERDLSALDALSGQLADDIEAALPSGELFAPPVRLLGNDGGAGELDGFVF